MKKVFLVLCATLLTVGCGGDAPTAAPKFKGTPNAKLGEVTAGDSGTQTSGALEGKAK